MITLDVDAIVALALRGDPDHAPAVRSVMEARRPLVVPVAVLSGVDERLRSRHARPASLALLESIQRGETLVDPGDLDPPRILELMRTYPELPLAQAAVVACAERHGGAILTLDRDRLGVVAREVPVTLLP